VSGPFELPNPELGLEEVREVLAEHWALDGELAEVGSTQDQNVRVTGAGGRRYVCKVASPLWPPAALDLQNAAMRHLAAARPGFAVPEPVRALGGEEVVRAHGHHIRLLTWVDGTPLADAGPLGLRTWRALGELAAESALGLEDFEHPELDRVLQWDTRHAEVVVATLTDDEPPEVREGLAAALAGLRDVAALAGDLPVQPIHCDVTDLNTVTRGRRPPLPAGLLDFGDVVRTWRICDPVHAAVAAIAHEQADPLGVALAVLAGYHAQAPLREPELAAFWSLVLARAAVCAAHSTRQARLSPGNAHIARAVAADWAALDAAAGVPRVLADAAVRALAGLDPSPAGSALAAGLGAAGCVPVVDGTLEPVDLSVASDRLAFGEWRSREALGPVLAVADGALAVTRWGEVRPAPGDPSATAPDTLHLGADVVAPAGTPLRAPLAGTVADGAPVGELWLACPVGASVAHVRLAGVETEVQPGAAVAAGAPVGRIAPAGEGVLPAHVHVQVGVVPGLPGLGRAREREAWLALSPDPSPLVGRDVRAPAPPDPAGERARRAGVVAAPQRLYFDEPPEIVRGWRHWLYDAEGRPYVDVINNVAVLGHSHPAVAAAAARGLRLLNTNSRFLYGVMTEYAERLAALLPEPLDTVFLVNSGSEAVDLALRLARTATGRHDVVALEGAYHGWTTATDELCANAADRPAWRETLAPGIHIVEQPDPYRGRFGDDGPAYAGAVRAALEAAAGRGGAAAFVAEPLLGNQGGIALARGYLAEAYAAARAAGALCVADEVQVGYGRTGDTFWAFEHEGVVPDVVCVAKATGNGHPVGAVICSRAVADAFDRTAPFFSSTGGGPVSCRIGLAVLDASRPRGCRPTPARSAAACGQAWRSSPRCIPSSGRSTGAASTSVSTSSATAGRRSPRRSRRWRSASACAASA
jgi:4-aminobutyrate aminotransferase-like enzyme/Ser/Thr protein kinase RdoA (MazF antagonist)